MTFNSSPIQGYNKFKSLKTEDEQGSLEQMLELKKSTDSSKFNDDEARDFMLESDEKRRHERKASNLTSIDRKIESLLDRDQLKFRNEHKTFTQLTKARKFKVYYKNKDNEDVYNNFSSNNILKSTQLAFKQGSLTLKNFKKNSKSKIKESHDGLHGHIGSLQISNLSTKINNTVLLDSQVNGNLNKSNQSFLKTLIGKNTTTFLTNQDKLSNREQIAEEGNNKIYNKIFNNDHHEATMYSSIDMIPVLKRGNATPDKRVRHDYNPKPATLDPDFFIKHGERAPDKKTMMNFNTNPSLFKRRPLDSFMDKKNLEKFKPELYKSFKEEVARQLFLRKQLSNRHDMFKVENYVEYTDTFNKFCNNPLKVQTDFKNLIFNSKTDNFYKGIDTIRDLCKTELKSRGLKSNTLNKEPKYKKEKKNVQPRNLRYDEVLREIKESKERFFNNFNSSANEMLSAINNETLFKSVNISEKILDENEKNVLGYNISPRTMQENQLIEQKERREHPVFKRNFQSMRVKARFQSDDKDVLHLKISNANAKEKEKEKGNIQKTPRVFPEINVSRSKKSPNATDLIKKTTKHQESILSNLLGKVYSKEELKNNFRLELSNNI